MCLSLEILHFNVKNHVAIDMLKPIWWLLTLGYNLECNLNVLHFFLYGILPGSVSILLVNGISLFDLLGSSGPNLWVILSTAPSHHGFNSVSFLQNIMNPPVKCWFMLDALHYGIFEPGLEATL